MGFFVFSGIFVDICRFDLMKPIALDNFHIDFQELPVFNDEVCYSLQNINISLKSKQ